jgi:hypothetical protein
VKEGYILEDKSRIYRASPDYVVAEKPPKDLPRLLDDLKAAADFTIGFEYVPEGAGGPAISDDALKSEVEHLRG